jgi:hypothetical protein
MAVSVDGIVGVKFGMVNDVDNLNNLTNEVQKTGKNVEESFINNRVRLASKNCTYVPLNVLLLFFKIIQNMAGIIKQGIEKANEDLKRENEKKIQQEVIERFYLIIAFF